MTDDTKDHIWQNMDKFILVFLFLVVLAVAVHMYHDKMDVTGIQWIQGVVSSVLTGLTAVLGSKALSRAFDKNGNSNGNGEKNEVTKTQISTTTVASSGPKPTL